MKSVALGLLVAFVATLAGCAAAPSAAPARLPCASLTACDRLYSVNPGR
jgi:hypothetical protein